MEQITFFTLLVVLSGTTMTSDLPPPPDLPVRGQPLDLGLSSWFEPIILIFYFILLVLIYSYS